MAATEQVLKLTISQYRKPGITSEEYHAHWSWTHGPLAAEWLSRNNILKYIQYHTPPSTRALLDPLSKAAGWKVTPFDGHVEFWVRSVDDVVRAVNDPFYKENVAPDEEKFVDRDRIEVTLGWGEVYVEDGKIVDKTASETESKSSKGGIWDYFLANWLWV